MENPWREFKSAERMVHDLDKEVVEKHNLAVSRKYQFLLHLAPEPWIGDVQSKLVVLYANPGATSSDQNGVVQYKDNLIKELSISNLRQEESQYPHFFFNPILSGTQGQAWYFRNLGHLIKDLGKEKISRSLLTCEMAPYHSVSWKKTKKPLPTQKYTLKLVTNAIERGATILIHRGFNYWRENVPGLDKYPKAFLPRSSRTPYISPGNYPDAYPLIIETLSE